MTSVRLRVMVATAAFALAACHPPPDEPPSPGEDASADAGGDEGSSDASFDVEASSEGDAPEDAPADESSAPDAADAGDDADAGDADAGDGDGSDADAGDADAGDADAGDAYAGDGGPGGTLAWSATCAEAVAAAEQAAPLVAPATYAFPSAPRSIADITFPGGCPVGAPDAGYGDGPSPLDPGPDWARYLGFRVEAPMHATMFSPTGVGMLSGKVSLRSACDDGASDLACRSFVTSAQIGPGTWVWALAQGQMGSFRLDPVGPDATHVDCAHAIAMSTTHIPGKPASSFSERVFGGPVDPKDPTRRLRYFQFTLATKTDTAIDLTSGDPITDVNVSLGSACGLADLRSDALPPGSRMTQLWSAQLAAGTYFVTTSAAEGAAYALNLWTF
jgi:hypothetical protein